MTGRHRLRSGTYSVLRPPGSKDGMVPWEYTIGELLSDAGYATALCGRWRNRKTIKRMTAGPGMAAIDRPCVEPQLPLVFDLPSDPHEDSNSCPTTLTMDWRFDPVFHAVGTDEECVTP